MKYRIREKASGFQSRNRDTSLFRESRTVGFHESVLEGEFQSRNRDTSLFREIQLSNDLYEHPLSFNLAIEILLFSG